MTPWRERGAVTVGEAARTALRRKCRTCDARFSGCGDGPEVRTRYRRWRADHRCGANGVSVDQIGGEMFEYEHREYLPSPKKEPVAKQPSVDRREQSQATRMRDLAAELGAETWPRLKHEDATDRALRILEWAIERESSEHNLWVKSGYGDWWAGLRNCYARSMGAPLRRVAQRIREKTCGVYVIQCETTGKWKIGKSTNVASRLASHANELVGRRMEGPLRLRRLICCSERSLGFVEVLMHWIYEPSRTGALEIFAQGLTPSPDSVQNARDVARLAARIASECLQDERGTLP